MLLAAARDVAHSLDETEVVAYVLVDLGLILAAARLFNRFASREPQARLPYDELELERELAEVDPAVNT